MIERFKEHISFGLLLNLLLPGAGHLYWREYLFGTFVFLVMVIASVLFFFSFLVNLPLVLKATLFGLPTLFYAFTFVDLGKVICLKRTRKAHSVRLAWIVILAALALSFILPLSPLNFALRNRPQIARVEAGQLGTLTGGSSLCLVDRSAYRVNLFFLDEPYPRRLPERWDLVLFHEPGGLARTGLVLALGGEEATFFNDSLFVDGFPMASHESLSLEHGGQVPLLRVDSDRLLVATLKQGAIDEALQVWPRDVIGKVHRLF